MEVQELPKDLCARKQRTKGVTMQKYSLKNRPTWALISYWVVPYYKDPGTRQNKQLASHNWHCIDGSTMS